MVSWLDSLSETKYVAVRAAIVDQLEVHGINLAATHWMKPLGGGLYELRIRHDRIEIPAGDSVRARILLRIFLVFRPGKRCVLLDGYDKAENPSKAHQQRQIRRARRLAQQLIETERRR